MPFKLIFDKVMSFLGLLCLGWLLFVTAVLIKVCMPGPIFFIQDRVGKNGKIFKCHKFRTMVVDHGGSSVSVAGQNRITPLGAKLRRYKIDELPELWDVFIGNMSFVGPRPDVPGYADRLTGQDCDILKLRPGITGPASLKYRDEEDMIAEYVVQNKGKNGLDDEQLAIWYNDNVIYPDKVRLNLYYLNHYSFFLDIKMIFCTIFGKRMSYNGEII